MFAVGAGEKSLGMGQVNESLGWESLWVCPLAHPDV